VIFGAVVVLLVLNGGGSSSSGGADTVVRWSPDLDSSHVDLESKGRDVVGVGVLCAFGAGLGTLGCRSTFRMFNRWRKQPRTPIQVCVTGAGGYVATHIVQQLLARGYSVKGTVRSMYNLSKFKHLFRLDGAEERLDLVEADILNSTSMELATRGCAYIIHPASPFSLNSKGDTRNTILLPAIKGTENVIAAAQKNKIRRVVLTSSLASMVGSPKEKQKGHVLDEDDWNLSSTLRDAPFHVSKKLAEKRAWDVAKAHGVDLVVINPGFILGPQLSKRTDAESVKFMTKLTNSWFPMLVDLPLMVVDVRDVALAHIRAMERKSASGRYICVGKVMSFQKIVEILRSNIPSLRMKLPRHRLPTKCLASLLAPWLGTTRSFVRDHVGIPMVPINTTKIESQLGMAWTAIDETIVDMARSLGVH